MPHSSFVSMTPLILYLSLHAFILVVEAVVVTTSGASRDKINHFILVETQIAGVGVCVLVVDVELAGIARALLLFAVFRKIHIDVL